MVKRELHLLARETSLMNSASLFDDILTALLPIAWVKDSSIDHGLNFLFYVNFAYEASWRAIG